MPEVSLAAAAAVAHPRYSLGRGCGIQLQALGLQSCRCGWNGDCKQEKLLLIMEKGSI